MKVTESDWLDFERRFNAGQITDALRQLARRLNEADPDRLEAIIICAGCLSRRDSSDILGTFTLKRCETCGLLRPDWVIVAAKIVAAAKLANVVSTRVVEAWREYRRFRATFDELAKTGEIPFDVVGTLDREEIERIDLAIELLAQRIKSRRTQG